MAAANIPSSDLSFFSNANFARNSVEIEFVDEDDLPLANVCKHQALNDEVDSDFAESKSDSDEEEKEDHASQPGNTCRWERNITARSGLPFYQQEGPTIPWAWVPEKASGTQGSPTVELNEGITVLDFCKYFYRAILGSLD